MVEVEIVGEGIAKESVAAGKLAAVEVAAVNDGMVKPTLLVAPVPIYPVVSGMLGREEGALVVRLICGIAIVEVESGSAVPEVTPAVGMAPPAHA